MGADDRALQVSFSIYFIYFLKKMIRNLCPLWTGIKHVPVVFFVLRHRNLFSAHIP